METPSRQQQRKFGQNFLIDPEIVERIIDDICEISSLDGVIEIGPGKGAISKQLIPKAEYFLAIEKDSVYYEYCLKKYTSDNVFVMKADGKFVKWKQIQDFFPIIKKIKPTIVGNLPYNQATAIIFNLLKWSNRVRVMYFMVQYEVAKRLCASIGTRNFGALSVIIQNYYTVTIKQKINPDAFRPRPKVFSATVQFTPKKPENIFQCELFPRFIHLAFSQKRKKLTNSLQSEYPKKLIESTLNKLHFDSNIRAENLTVENFIYLYKTIKEDHEE